MKQPNHSQVAADFPSAAMMSGYGNAMAKPWFRLYAEFSGDPKIQMLAFEDQRHFVVLLCLKCCGALDTKTPSEEFRERMVSKALGLDALTASEVKRRLLEVGIIRKDWQPTHWDARQYDSDSSTERTRKWRAKRHGDVTVTDQSRTEQSRTFLSSSPNPDTSGFLVRERQEPLKGVLQSLEAKKRMPF